MAIWVLCEAQEEVIPSLLPTANPGSTATAKNLVRGLFTETDKAGKCVGRVEE